MALAPIAGARNRACISLPMELNFALFAVSCQLRGENRKEVPWVSSFLQEHGELAQRVVSFWDDGDYLEWGEVLVLAFHAGRLLDERIDPFLKGLEATAGEKVVTPPLPSESPEVLRLIAERIARLRDSAELRAAYARLLREFWAAVAPAWERSGRALALAHVEIEKAQLARATDPREVVPPNSICLREQYSEVIDQAVERGELVLVPLGLAGEGQTFFVFPGLVLVGSGPESRRRIERLREQSERAAGRFKLFSDPTRLAILSRLTTHRSSISDLATVFGLAQPTVSVHVKQLREAGLLEQEKVGGFTLYHAPAERLREVLEDTTADVLDGQAPGPQKDRWGLRRARRVAAGEGASGGGEAGSAD